MPQKNHQKGTKNEAQQILKRIEAESQQQKRQKTLNILQRSKPSSPSLDAIPSIKTKYFNLINSFWSENSKKLYRKASSAQFQKTFYLTAFLMVSTYICWKVEKKYDTMRKKSSNTKSMKERQVQQENRRITEYLQKNEYEPVPIGKEPEVQNKYKYQQQFDTRDYLLDQMAKDYNQDKSLVTDPVILKQLKEKGLI